MLERATASIIALTAIAAATALAVFAAGFALNALLLQWLTPAGAAACVAAAAALFTALTAIIMRARAERLKLMEEVARARAQSAPPPRDETEEPLAAAAPPADLAGWLHDHPLMTVGVSALTGFLATRHPGLAKEIIAALRSRPR